MNNPQTKIIGFDLGTTNSTGARLEGTAIRVFRSLDQQECIPSAVLMDKQNKMRVGKMAYEKAELDPGNVAIEFKRGMGAKDEFRFASSGLTMRSEQLSAEVLKSLRADAERATGEAVTQAVITVPAYFELPGREATCRAAALAGITQVDLIQEPVAAAMAYSFERETDKAFWLIYDLGGGTFDTTLVQLRDGVVDVITHGGDNRLGGKNIDWLIVEKLLIPAASRQLDVSDMERGNPKWITALAKLKWAAEQAKKQLSGEETAEVSIEHLGPAGSDGVAFEHVLQRSEVEALTAPLVARTIDICRDVIKRAKLEPRHVNKIVLVGGPTLMPLVRQTLVEGARGLGIALATDIDPMTVVARGAAIFGASQSLKHAGPNGANGTAHVTPPGHFAVQIKVPALSPDTDILVPLTLVPAQGETVDFTGYTVEFSNSSSQTSWRSDKIPVAADGKVSTTVLGEQNIENHFQIELLDATGRRQEITPATFTVTVKGPVHTAPPLTHTLGVALADNTVAVFLPQGIALPARRTHRLRTAMYLRAGEAGQLLRVPVVEGQHLRADRNKRVGILGIPSEGTSRDVPYNSPIDITIECDKSQVVKVRAYLDVLDEDFENVLSSESATLTVDELNERLDELEKRHTSLIEEAEKLQEPQVVTQLKTPGFRDRVSDICSLIKAAVTDNDAARQAADAILAAHIVLDDIEPGIEWPRKRERTLSQIRDTEKIVRDNKHATDSDRAKAKEIVAQAQEAIAQRDEHRLELLHKELLHLEIEIIDRDPGFWASIFISLKMHPPQFTDPVQSRH